MWHSFLTVYLVAGIYSDLLFCHSIWHSNLAIKILSKAPISTLLLPPRSIDAFGVTHRQETLVQPHVLDRPGWPGHLFMANGCHMGQPLGCPSRKADSLTDFAIIAESGNRKLHGRMRKNSAPPTKWTWPSGIPQQIPKLSLPSNFWDQPQSETLVKCMESLHFRRPGSAWAKPSVFSPLPVAPIVHGPKAFRRHWRIMAHPATGNQENRPKPRRSYHDLFATACGFIPRPKKSHPWSNWTWKKTCWNHQATDDFLLCGMKNARVTL